MPYLHSLSSLSTLDSIENVVFEGSVLSILRINFSLLSNSHCSQFLFWDIGQYIKELFKVEIYKQNLN